MLGNRSNGFVPVDGQVKSQKLSEFLVITETKKSGQIMRVILGGIDGREFSLTEDITVYAASDVRKFGNAKDILSVLDG
jgi:hypothetical protein